MRYIIRQAKKENKDIKIKIVDPSFNQERTKRFLLNFISDWGKISDFVFKEINKNELISEQYNVEIYKMNFRSYLQKKL